MHPITRTPRRFCTLVCGALASTSAAPAMATFVEGDLSDGSSTIASGQSFVVGLEPSPDPGLPSGDPVTLQNVRFTSGGGGVGATETFLAIMPGAFYDFNGDPNGTFTPTVSDAVGVSTNAIDTTALSYGDAIGFDFGAGLDVAYGDVLSAVFVTVNGAQELTPVDVSTAFILFVEDPPGTFLPASNYGGAGNFNATALFPDFNADGFFEAASDAQDLSFSATFEVVPEPSAAALLAAGVVAARRRRRVA
ncbi:MAG: PEP-CTERM sorting domain-containing protein [Planctomycetota bacterium]